MVLTILIQTSQCLNTNTPVQGEKHAFAGNEPLSSKEYHFPPAGTVEKGQEEHGRNQGCVGRMEA